MKEAIKRLRSIGERGMAQSDYREVNDSLALYRQDLELVLSVHNDVARYFELSKNPTSNTNPNEIRPYIEWANELTGLEKQILSKVGKE